MEESKGYKIEEVSGQPYVILNSGHKMPLMGYGTYKAD